MAKDFPKDFKEYCKYLAYTCSRSSGFEDPFNESTYRIDIKVQDKDGKSFTIYVATDIPNVDIKLKNKVGKSFTIYVAAGIPKVDYYLEINPKPSISDTKKISTMKDAHEVLLTIVKEIVPVSIGDGLLAYDQFIVNADKNLSDAEEKYKLDSIENIKRLVKNSDSSDEQTAILRETDNESTRLKKTDDKGVVNDVDSFEKANGKPNNGYGNSNDARKNAMDAEDEMYVRRYAAESKLRFLENRVSLLKKTKIELEEEIKKLEEERSIALPENNESKLKEEIVSLEETARKLEAEIIQLKEKNMSIPSLENTINKLEKKISRLEEKRLPFEPDDLSRLDDSVPKIDEIRTELEREDTILLKYKNKESPLTETERREFLDLMQMFWFSITCAFELPTLKTNKFLQSEVKRCLRDFESALDIFIK